MSKQSWADIVEEEEREEREQKEKREKKRKKQELEALYGKKKKKKKKKKYKSKTKLYKVAPESSAAADSVPEPESSVTESSMGESKSESSAVAAKPRMTALERMANLQRKTQKAYRKREHQAAALKQLKRLNTDFHASGDAFIKPGKSVFKEFPLFSGCPDIHFHVYNGGAGIRFRFNDGSELQFNDGDGGRKNGVVLTRWHGTRVRDLILGRQNSDIGLSRFAELVNNKVSDSWNFNNTEAGEAVKELHRIGNLTIFLEQIEQYVLVAAAAGTEYGAKGGRRKTRKRKRKRGKKKTRKNKKKRKTKRKKKYRKKRTKRRR